MPEITITEFEVRRKQARVMVKLGIASDTKEALARLKESENKRNKAGLVIFYTDTMVKMCLGDKIIGERMCWPEVRTAFIESGFISRLMGRPDKSEFVVGKIIELVSKDGEWSQIFVVVEGFRIFSRNGIYFSTNSAERLRGEGKIPFNERYPEKNLYRWEIDTPNSGIVPGIFSAWNRHPVASEFPLVLYIPKNKVIIFS
ncbi:MAG: hypothetical protein PHZ04_04550 [Patescibacteria group bacterium]|nr:hypothetical protein [Patescibacteria group bacterium]